MFKEECAGWPALCHGTEQVAPERRRDALEWRSIRLFFELNERFQVAAETLASDGSATTGVSLTPEAANVAPFRLGHGEATEAST